MSEAEMQEISVEQLHEILEQNKGTRWLDVREEYEYRQVHLDQALNYPLTVLDASKISKELGLDTEEPIYFICRSGVRSITAATAFSEIGFKKVINVAGGILEWQQSGYAVKER